MWTIQTPWFDVALFMSLYSVGIILFGHFEQHKPAWRRLLKPVMFLALLMTLAQTVGRSWAYGVLGFLFCAAGSFHFVWLSKQASTAGRVNRRIARRTAPCTEPLPRIVELRYDTATRRVPWPGPTCL